MTNDQLHAVHTRIGIRRSDDPTTLVLEPYPHLLVQGRLAMTVFVLMVDMAGGFDAHVSSGDDWTFTSDLSLRVSPLAAPPAVFATSHVVRAGRHAMQTEVRIVDAAGREIGFGAAGFSRHPRRAGDNPKPDIESASQRWAGIRLLDRPLFDAIGLRVVDAATGHVEVELVPELRNPAGIMQGAMIAAVAEAAALALASRDGGAHVVTDLDMRFLSMGRIGPVWSRARFIAGTPAIAVDLHDGGDDDRLMSTLLLRTTRVG